MIITIYNIKEQHNNIYSFILVYSFCLLSGVTFFSKRIKIFTSNIDWKVKLLDLKKAQ